MIDVGFRNNQLKSIIENECLLRGFSSENIRLACKRAKLFFNQDNTFSKSIDYGVSLVEIWESNNKSPKLDNPT